MNKKSHSNKWLYNKTIPKKKLWSTLFQWYIMTMGQSTLAPNSWVHLPIEFSAPFHTKYPDTTAPLEADTKIPSLQLDSQSPCHLEAVGDWAYTSRSKYLSRKGRKSCGHDQGAIEPPQYAVLILAWERDWRPEGRHVSSAPQSMGDVCPQAISKGLGQGALVNWKLHPQHPCSLPWLPQSNLQENVQWCKYHAAAA